MLVVLSNYIFVVAFYHIQLHTLFVIHLVYYLAIKITGMGSPIMYLKLHCSIALPT